jgi:hypothetical protein
MGDLNPLTFSINIDTYVVILSIYLFLIFKDFILCSQNNATFWLLVFSSGV